MFHLASIFIRRFGGLFRSGGLLCRCRGCGRRGGIQPKGCQVFAFHQGVKLFAADLFAFHQHTGHTVQLSHVLGHNAAGRLVRFIHDITDLIINFGRRIFGIALALAKVSAKEGFARVGAINHRAHALREAIAGHHGAGGIRGTLQVVGGTGGDIIQPQLLRRTAARYGSGIEVLAYPGTGFVELVEGDREDTPEAEAAVRAAVEPMLARGADQIVLGCTHYPFLTPVMERIVDGRAAIVDPSPAVARRVGQLLDRYGLRASADNRPALTFRTFADELYRLRLERKVAAYL